MAVHVLPPSGVFQRRCDEAYRMCGSAGEKMIGYVHCQRSRISLDGSPEYIHGYGFTSVLCPVRRLNLFRKPPLFVPAKYRSGSFGSGAM